MEKGRAKPKVTRGAADDSDEDIDSIPVPLPSTAKVDLSDIEKVEKAYNLKQGLLDRLEALSDRLPLNTLDELIDQLGGTDYVAELTGSALKQSSPAYVFLIFCPSVHFHLRIAVNCQAVRVASFRIRTGPFPTNPVPSLTLLSTPSTFSRKNDS